MPDRRSRLRSVGPGTVLYSSAIKSLNCLSRFRQNLALVMTINLSTLLLTCLVRPYRCRHHQFLSLPRELRNGRETSCDTYQANWYLHSYSPLSVQKVNLQTKIFSKMLIL